MLWILGGLAIAVLGGVVIVALLKLAISIIGGILQFILSLFGWD